PHDGSRPNGPRYRSGLRTTTGKNAAQSAPGRGRDAGRAGARVRPLRFEAEPLLEMLTHLCALAALGYVVRVAQYASSWAELRPLRSAPAPPLPTGSIIVPARNEERSIAACVRSLVAQRWIDGEIIVVD